MKRILSLVLSVILILTLFTGCGKTVSQVGGDSGKTAATDTGSKGGGGDDSAAAGSNAGGDGAGNSGNSSGIYKEAGMELSDYYTAITDAEKPFDDNMQNLENADMDILGAQVTVAMPALALSCLGMYDLLSMEDSPKKEGTLMLSGYHGIREKKGNVIKFTGTMEYTEDTAMNKKGDKVSEQGSLDMSTNTLVYESKVERGGKVSSRTVIESVILKDGTYLLQYFSTSDGSGITGKPTGVASFKRYNTKEYTALAASLDSNPDFKYDSIVGKGDVKPDTMASKYTVNGRFTVKDGKAEAAKK